MLRRFEQAAEAILRGGAAGFGELAAEHFSSRIGSHPYESAPADHPLFLALADIAARADVPIELHMEAVPRDLPFPNPALMGPPNPPAVHETFRPWSDCWSTTQDACNLAARRLGPVRLPDRAPHAFTTEPTSQSLHEPES